MATNQSTKPPTNTATPRYFRSFAGYEIPFHREDPLDFTATEGLSSYYQATFDQAGRVIRFDKIRIVRVARQTIEFSVWLEPGKLAYFHAICNSADDIFSVGSPLEYPQTEQLREFWVGEVDSSGHACLATLLRREVAFSDTYAYGPTGDLRKRTMISADRSPVVTQFDERGSPLTTELALSGGSAVIS